MSSLKSMHADTQSKKTKLLTQKSTPGNSVKMRKLAEDIIA